MEESDIQFLQQLKIDCTQNDVPAVPEVVARFLYDQILKYNIESALEIGSAWGYSTLWLTHALEQTNGHLTSIEHSAPSVEITKENIKKADRAHFVDVHLGNAQDIIPLLHKKFDFAFIDGRKRDYKEFLDVVKPKLTPNAVIIFDNVKKFPEKTQHFWDYVENQHEFEYEALSLTDDDGLLILRKK